MDSRLVLVLGCVSAIGAVALRVKNAERIE
jgi:hypothetical protein